MRGSRTGLHTRWRDGTTHVVFEPSELLEKLAALIPPPRFHLVRYHGILGPAAGQRPHVVPNKVAWDDSAPAPPETPERPIGTDDSRGTVPREPTRPETRLPRVAASHLDRRPDASEAAGAAARSDAGATDSPDDGPGRARRLAWANLLRRVFAVDVLEARAAAGASDRSPRSIRPRRLAPSSSASGFPRVRHRWRRRGCSRSGSGRCRATRGERNSTWCACEFPLRSTARHRAAEAVALEDAGGVDTHQLVIAWSNVASSTPPGPVSSRATDVRQARKRRAS